MSQQTEILEQSEAYLGPCQTWMSDPFCKNVIYRFLSGS